MGIGENVVSSGREKKYYLGSGNLNSLCISITSLSVNLENHVTALTFGILICNKRKLVCVASKVSFFLFSFLTFLLIQIVPGYTYRVQLSLTVPAQIHFFL